MMRQHIRLLWAPPCQAPWDIRGSQPFKALRRSHEVSCTKVYRFQRTAGSENTTAVVVLAYLREPSLYTKFQRRPCKSRKFASKKFENFLKQQWTTQKSNCPSEPSDGSSRTTAITSFLKQQSWKILSSACLEEVIPSWGGDPSSQRFPRWLAVLCLSLILVWQHLQTFLPRSTALTYETLQWDVSFMDFKKSHMISVGSRAEVAARTKQQLSQCRFTMTRKFSETSYNLRWHNKQVMQHYEQRYVLFFLKK